MFLAAVVHRWVFSFEDYKQDEAANSRKDKQTQEKEKKDKFTFCQAVCHTFNHREIGRMLMHSITGAPGLAVSGVVDAVPGAASRREKESTERKENRAARLQDEAAWGAE